MGTHFNFYKASIKDLDAIIRLRLALLKEVGEIKSAQEEELV